MRQTWIGILSIALLIGAAESASAVAVTLNPGGDVSSLRSRATYPGIVIEEFNPAATPYSDSHEASDRGNVASTTYDLSDAGYTISFSHERQDAALGGLADSTGEIYFSVDSDVGYSVSGSYVVSDVVTPLDPDGSEVMLNVRLIDKTLNERVLSSGQWSLSTPNESFTLGLQEGDFSNYLAGSLTGTLLAGHVYTFAYTGLIFAESLPSSTATAEGFVSLVFVPEPSIPALSTTGRILLAMGLVGLAASRRFRQ